MSGFGVHVGYVVPGHEAGEHCHHHLWFHFGDVFGQCVDASTDLACHGQSVLGVGGVVLKTTTQENLILEATREIEKYPLINVSIFYNELLVLYSY